MYEYRISASLTGGLRLHPPGIPVTRESSGCTGAPIRLAIDRTFSQSWRATRNEAACFFRAGSRVADRSGGRERRVSATIVRALISALGGCAALAPAGARAECDRAAADVSWVRLQGAE